MKKLLSLILVGLMLFGGAITAYAEDGDNIAIPNEQEVLKMAEDNAIVRGDIKKYDSFEVAGKEIRLYPETLVTAEQAMEMYPNAYKMCSEIATEYKISTSIDDKEFQELAKIYAAMNENGSEDFIAECMEFATFLDYYENAKLNEEILSLATKKGVDSADEIEALMPHYRNSTAPAGDSSVKEDAIQPTKGEYDTAAVVEYASNWWNKTNNTDYSYYASYHNFDTSTNKYNDLDQGRSGQSSPRRGWSDCADFVSQCLAAGGVPQIKNGLILPHTKTGK